jgi:hypothetical protein
VREEQSQSKRRVREEQSTVGLNCEIEALSPQAPTDGGESILTLIGNPGESKAKRETPKKPDHCSLVFEAWSKSIVETRGNRSAPRHIFDEKRRKCISAALKLCPLEDVIDAVRGWRHDPFSRGENDRGTPYNELTLLLRDAAHIEKFRDLERSHKALPAASPPPESRPIRYYSPREERDKIELARRRAENPEWAAECDAKLERDRLERLQARAAREAVSQACQA